MGMNKKFLYCTVVLQKYDYEMTKIIGSYRLKTYQLHNKKKLIKKLYLDNYKVSILSQKSFSEILKYNILLEINYSLRIYNSKKNYNQIPQYNKYFYTSA